MKRDPPCSDGLEPTVRRLRETTGALVMRSDEIYALALDADAAASGIFSKKENARTADLCIAFMEAVAGTSSVEDIRAARQDILRLQDHVLAANEAVADRVRENPQVLSSFVNGLHTLFRLLLEADPTIRVVAGFASEHKGGVRHRLLGRSRRGGDGHRVPPVAEGGRRRNGESEQGVRHLGGALPLRRTAGRDASPSDARRR